MGIDCDQSIVCRASSQCSGTRVEGAQQLGARRGVQPSIDGAIRGFVAGLVVSSLAGVVGVVVNKEVPGDVLFLRDSHTIRWDSVVVLGTVVITSLKQQSTVTSKGEASSERPSASPRANYDILVASEVDGSCSCGKCRGGT